MVDSQSLSGSGNVINNNFNIIHNFLGVPQQITSDSVTDEAHVERTGRSVTNQPTSRNYLTQPYSYKSSGAYDTGKNLQK